MAVDTLVINQTATPASSATPMIGNNSGRTSIGETKYTKANTHKAFRLPGNPVYPSALAARNNLGSALARSNTSPTGTGSPLAAFRRLRARRNNPSPANPAPITTKPSPTPAAGTPTTSASRNTRVANPITPSNPPKNTIHQG